MDELIFLLRFDPDQSKITGSKWNEIAGSVCAIEGGFFFLLSFAKKVEYCRRAQLFELRG